MGPAVSRVYQQCAAVAQERVLHKFVTVVAVLRRDQEECRESA
jgi:hypothetical protein